VPRASLGVFGLGAGLAALGGVIGGGFLGVYPGADFEVRVERRDGLPPHLLRTFRTGSGPDTQAPELTGAAQAKAVREPRLNTCSTGELHVELILGQDPSAGQPQTDPAILYGVWRAGRSPLRAPARNDPPLTYVEAYDGKIVLGYPHVCGLRNFVIPDPKVARAVAFEIRRIDLAGNQSAPRRIEVDLRHPRGQ